MATYPEHVTAASRRAADRFYRRLPNLPDIPAGYDLDDLIDRSDSDGAFIAGAIPDRTDND